MPVRENLYTISVTSLKCRHFTLLKAAFSTSLDISQLMFLFERNLTVLASII
ncbi:hypothetical protein J6590_010097 [Homalodisca vitripennis]|nr:hypothetical protein J6590_010097 [Homalodisca vitripennis]